MSVDGVCSARFGLLAGVSIVPTGGHAEPSQANLPSVPFEACRGTGFGEDGAEAGRHGEPGDGKSVPVSLLGTFNVCPPGHVKSRNLSSSQHWD